MSAARPAKLQTERKVSNELLSIAYSLRTYELGDKSLCPPLAYEDCYESDENNMISISFEQLRCQLIGNQLFC